MADSSSGMNAATPRPSCDGKIRNLAGKGAWSWLFSNIAFSISGPRCGPRRLGRKCIRRIRQSEYSDVSIFAGCRYQMVASPQIWRPCNVSDETSMSAKLLCRLELAVTVVSIYPYFFHTPHQNLLSSPSTRAIVQAECGLRFS